EDTVNARLMEVAVASPDAASTLIDTPKSGLGRAANAFTSPFKPIQSWIAGSDDDLSHRLTQAGFRKAEHIEIFAAAKLLLPVLGIIAGTFFGKNMMAAILLGAVAGFFGPDIALGRFIARRKAAVRSALPDALDLLVICMEAGLGIDQALARVG